MTDEEKEEVKKMIKQAVDESTLRLRQKIVNARHELVDRIQALENKRNG